MPVRSAAGVYLRRLLVVIITTVATMGLAITGPSHAAGSGGVHYVALGDSRASGPSITTSFDADGCNRSGGGYPERIARALRPASFTDVACAGATSDEVADRPQTTSLPVVRTVPAQARALRRDTGLVTLSVGGNDMKWGSLISPCFGFSLRTDEHCRSNGVLRALITARLAALSVSVDHVLRVVSARAPNARVFVVGHGGYYGPRGCVADANVSPADAAFIRDFFRRFDAVLSGSAQRHGATFVDVAGPAVGHDACAPESRRWFTGQLPRGNGLPNHPTQMGNAAIARLVLAAITR
ncbi:SGNH/GDSL hydrolase family protein [Williamsia sp.]|uniref:SGNH/GDSL hydrolase family protein n=1 Tax=Williamsia sp. TaxID=1872085 RepID=UPI001A346B60|nr:SGNH/GDSL hydrolase family protein [Williamsia sp.]MBJ7287787.1 SGNH/GDSL hydrolase family protein [Williamsia sp.]